MDKKEKPTEVKSEEKKNPLKEKPTVKPVYGMNTCSRSAVGDC